MYLQNNQQAADVIVFNPPSIAIIENKAHIF